MEAGERQRDLERLLTFVDAIVAIAITLLILPLVELAPALRDSGDVAGLLAERAGEVWSFVLSFYVIARFWLSQHDAVRPLLAADGRLSVLLLAWSFTIVVLPFPTSLVATAGREAVTKVFYLGTMLVSILLVTAIRAMVGRRPELTDGTPQKTPASGLVTAALLLVALVVMLLVPAASYLPMLVLFAEAPVLRIVQHLRSRST